jgi:hypothetical protein
MNSSVDAEIEHVLQMYLLISPWIHRVRPGQKEEFMTRSVGHVIRASPSGNVMTYIRNIEKTQVERHFRDAWTDMKTLSSNKP